MIFGCKGYRHVFSRPFWELCWHFFLIYFARFWRKACFKLVILLSKGFLLRLSVHKYLRWSISELYWLTNGMRSIFHRPSVLQMHTLEMRALQECLRDAESGEGEPVKSVCYQLAMLQFSIAFSLTWAVLKRKKNRNHLTGPAFSAKQ